MFTKNIKDYFKVLVLINIIYINLIYAYIPNIPSCPYNITEDKCVYYYKSIFSTKTTYINLPTNFNLE